MVLIRLSIVARLYLVLGLASLALFLVIGAAFIGSSHMVEAGRLIHEQGARGIEEASHLALLFERQRGLVSRTPAETDLDRQKDYRARFVTLSGELDTTLARLAPLVATSTKDKVLPQLAALFRTTRAQAMAIFDLAGNFVQDKATDVLDGPFSETEKQTEKTLAEVLTEVRATADGQLVVLSAARDFEFAAIAVVSLVGLLIVDGFGIFLARGLARRLQRITATMVELSGGDMKVEIAAANDGDEIGEMALALQVFKDNMIAARRLEAQLHHSQKLESLGTLAGGIAHDLNNTLVPIVALGKMAMKRLPDGSREQANMVTIQRAGERARDLVQQILAFSRKDAPKRELVDFAALLRDSLRMSRASLPATIRLEEVIDTVPLVYGDPSQLHQVVINLLVNAGQAIGASMGTITVLLAVDAEAAPSHQSADPPRPMLRLAVRDTGCGMDDATMQRVFEPFFTTKPVGEGTGLGLSVVHGIVTQHGGRMTVESRFGQGTCVTAYLPGLGEAGEAERLAAAEVAA
jgi:signal transduction histidine kinase